MLDFFHMVPFSSSELFHMNWWWNILCARASVPVVISQSRDVESVTSVYDRHCQTPLTYTRIFVFKERCQLSSLDRQPDRLYIYNLIWQVQTQRHLMGVEYRPQFTCLSISISGAHAGMYTREKIKFPGIFTVGQVGIQIH